MKRHLLILSSLVALFVLVTTVSCSRDTSFLSNPTNNGGVTEKTRPDGVQAGLNVVDNNTVTLVLDDQDSNGNHCDSAFVLGSFNNWTKSKTNKMYWDSTNNCWWLTVSNLDPSTEYTYQYYVYTKSGTVSIADPYSTKVSDPNDVYISSSTYPNLLTHPSQADGICSVFKTKTDTYNWQSQNFSISDPNNLRIYEMLLRDFTGGANDVGNIATAMTKLDYLKSLGMNAVELMPVEEFGGNSSWGYNPDFFFALDKAYGTTNDYKAFVDACHQRGMAVIMDVVYNDATNDFPYCKLYWDSNNNRPAANSLWFNPVAPHSWLTYFNDFNHSSACVQNYFIRNLKYMMSEFKVDGFRLDFAKGYTQTASTNDSESSAYDASRIAILKKYADAVHAANSNAVVILELFTSTQEENELAQDNMKVWDNMNNAYCQSAMGYVDSSDFSGLYTSTAMPFGSYVGYMESHDEERMAYKQEAYGVSSIKGVLSEEMKQLEANTCFFLTVPGPKMVWQFGEMGYDISKGSGTDKRLCHWEYLDDPNRAALHDVYEKLNSLRANHPEMFTSTASFSWQVGANNWSTGRFINIASADGSKHIVVAGNFDAATNTLNVPFPHSGTWHDYLNGNTAVNITTTNQAISFPMHTAIVYTDF